MYKVLPETIPAETLPVSGGAASASPSEKKATSVKLRSCVVCRTRKVRCDKQSPCSNCRRANIACVLPSTDRPPRWARRLASKTKASQEQDLNRPATSQVMERLRNLEDLVQELRGQLEQANAAATSSSAGGSSGVGSPESSTHDRATDHESGVRSQFGRLVLQDANRSRYVSSGFWSRVNDELDSLKLDSYGLGSDVSDTSEDEASLGKPPFTQELERTPSQRHAFLFRHNLSASPPDLREFHPLPSQIPFLLDVYAENVNSIGRIIHIPTVAKMVRNLRGSNISSLTPANEALMFSIYYAAVTSMEEDEVMTNFGITKTDLNFRYRLGLEHALAKADFLNVPDLTLVQAFTIFLFLVRRHDSPRFVWMMTGLLIRMGQALGLQRDGTHFAHLTPYEIEMRRRAWWALCMVDMRASEDQGTDYTITNGSFDTKIPLNINDADIEPETKQMPTERKGITDMTISLVWFEVSKVTKQMMAQSPKGEDVRGLEEQNRLLKEVYQKIERGYLQYSVESGNIVYWVSVTIARLVMAKMTLLIYLPILFSSPSEHFSDEVKTKLLIAAIEIAEYNHALNAEPECHHWRWVYQTYTHWYAIVYLLIEILRRPWSPMVERAWVALHSQWLIPAQSHMDKNLRIWVPLRKLTAKARTHRDAELERLRNDLQSAKRLEMEDEMMPIPASPGPFEAGSNVVELFRERWRELVAMPEVSRHDPWASQVTGNEVTTSAYSANTTQQSTNSVVDSNTILEPNYPGVSGRQTDQIMPMNTSPSLQLRTTTDAPGDFAIEQDSWPSYTAAPQVPTTWSMGPGFFSWLSASADPSVDGLANTDVDATDTNMDWDGQVDWYHWIESAKDIEMGTGVSGNGPV